MLWGYGCSHTVSRYQSVDREPVVRDFVYEDNGRRITMQVIVPD